MTREMVSGAQARAALPGLRGCDVTARDAGAGAGAGAARGGEARASEGRRAADGLAPCSAPAGAACAADRTSSAGRM